jgi:hypothetical protein
MRSQNPVLGRKILDLKQQFLIHQARDVREQTGHLATLHTACIFSGPDSKELSSFLTIRRYKYVTGQGLKRISGHYGSPDRSPRSERSPAVATVLLTVGIALGYRFS